MDKFRHWAYWFLRDYGTAVAVVATVVVVVTLILLGGSWSSEPGTCTPSPWGCE